MSEEVIRIAQIMGKMNSGGVESFIMNYYRNIDRNKIQFDFIVDEDSILPQKDEIEKLGGKIIKIPGYQNILKYIYFLTKILKKNNYKIVHSHLNSLSVFPLFCAYIAGVPVRIAHSHSTSNKKEWKKNILKNILKLFSRAFATNYFACSEHAGRWLFGNKTFEKGKIFILNNAICLEKFEYNEKIRTKIRKELAISDTTFVVGNIGRFVTQKNHEFLIEIFKKIHDENNNSLLLMVGQGPLQERIRKKVESLRLVNSVKFLNQRLNVNELYQAFDVFVLPSLYEGLGMVYIEAQASGLYTVASSEVPQIAKVTENMEFISLNENAKKWANIINERANKKNRRGYITEISQKGFDIKKETKKLENIYMKLLER